jgi:hypothetical protein
MDRHVRTGVLVLDLGDQLFRHQMGLLEVVLTVDINMEIQKYFSARTAAPEIVNSHNRPIVR